MLRHTSHTSYDWSVSNLAMNHFYVPILDQSIESFSALCFSHICLHMRLIFISILAQHLPFTFILPLPSTDRLLSCPPSLRSHPPPSLPPLSPSKKDNICSQTSVDGAETHLDADAEALGAKEEIKEVSDSPQRQAGSTAINRRPVLLGKVSDRSRGDWSWTVGENCYTAQWVKQKQEYRSTRPW